MGDVPTATSIIYTVYGLNPLDGLKFTWPVEGGNNPPLLSPVLCLYQQRKAMHFYPAGWPLFWEAEQVR